MDPKENQNAHRSLNNSCNGTNERTVSLTGAWIKQHEFPKGSGSQFILSFGQTKLFWI